RRLTRRQLAAESPSKRIAGATFARESPFRDTRSRTARALPSSHAHPTLMSPWFPPLALALASRLPVPSRAPSLEPPRPPPLPPRPSATPRPSSAPPPSARPAAAPLMPPSAVFAFTSRFSAASSRAPPSAHSEAPIASIAGVGRRPEPSIGDNGPAGRR